MTLHWVDSEKAFFFNFINNLVRDGGGQVRPVTSHDFRQVIMAMAIEQMRHVEGGAAYVQDPWPPRVFTYETVRQFWNHNRPEADQRYVDLQAAAQLRPENRPEEALVDAQGVGSHRIFEDQPAYQQIQLPGRELPRVKGFASINAILQRSAFHDQPGQVPGQPLRPLSRPEGMASLNAILQQTVAGQADIVASRDLLARMTVDQTTEEEFWAQFMRRFGGTQ
ncbi:hypothetical protein SBOR_5688 [Sclerotinia borealis F-4128]|uniref:Uncharacterized protein n=1 Tax=Sclerotinia borealis (strain F-4128) TaxID=1432307 RepID=W9CGR3_SCLBF|nr:hypothetical protein SBOR_5688 [Sclerotinia borealis F-4128]